MKNKNNNLVRMDIVAKAEFLILSQENSSSGLCDVVYRKVLKQSRSVPMAGQWQTRMQATHLALPWQPDHGRPITCCVGRALSEILR